jgi:phosphatidylglycerol---prolipoprotein diacylglyceryl transferase
MHPVLFEIGPFTLYTYGVLVMLGFLAAVWWSARTGPSMGISSQTMVDSAIWIFLVGVLMARVVFVLLNREDYRGVADMAMIWRGGLSFHGGVLGGFIGGAIFCTLRKVYFRNFIDVVAPSIALAYSIGRVGCFFNGCCYGIPTSQPWGLQFHSLYGYLTPPSHPAQIYSSIGGLALFALLAWINRRRVFHGETFLFFILFYSVYRYALEFVRGGVTGEYAAAGFTIAQIASVIFAVGAGAWIILAGRRAAAGTETEPVKVAA